MHLHTIMLGQAADILHSVLAYEDIVWAPKGHCGDQWLVAAYWSHKARIQLSCKSLQEFAAVVEQFAN
jgi:hypothetical protein